MAGFSYCVASNASVRARLKIVKATGRLKCGAPISNNKYMVCPKRNRTFFLKHLLIGLQLNKPCLLQSTPLHCLYTASNVFSSSGMRFAG
jgi:hypothetical protein